MPILYRTTASATGGRAGQAKSKDGVLDVTLTVPKELGGDGARGTNPSNSLPPVIPPASSVH